MDWYRTSQAERLVYHGTTADLGAKILADGELRPLSFTGELGNWNHGLYGGNPSNPDLVYCCTTFAMAVSYAREICVRANAARAAIVSCKPSVGDLVPDEDTVFESLQATASGAHDTRLWSAYAEVVGARSVEAARLYFRNVDESGEEADLQDYATNDAGLAEDMKRTAEILAGRMSMADKSRWMEDRMVVAFSSPLSVVDVEYFDL